VPIGTALALAFVRSPLITALTTLDLSELSGGRFILGLGTGVRRLNEDWHARPYQPPAPHMRETVTLIRMLLAEVFRGGAITFEGEFDRIRMRGFQRPYAPARAQTSIYIGGMGPAMLRLSGEIADGWIAHELCSPRYLAERALPRIRDGLRRAGRDRDSFTVMASACCLPSRDVPQARRLAAGLVAFYASVRTYEEFFDFHGFLASAKAIQARFAAGDIPGMIDACPDELVDTLTLVGTPDQIRARLREYEGLADVIKLTPPTHHVPPEVTRESQAAIVALLADS
jgi:probable F420-dependent oxidoreductase